MVPRREVDAPGRPTADRAPAFVIADGVLNAPRLKSGIACAQAEVNILKGEKLRLVQEAGTFKDRAADQHHASADGVHDLHGTGFQRRHAPPGGAVPHASCLP